uniref:Uncharacterized protein n=1 Tax=Arion vulgaris TaxID=1028688 RepID=A0A0B7BJ03_9EUPU
MSEVASLLVGLTMENNQEIGNRLKTKRTISFKLRVLCWIGNPSKEKNPETLTDFSNSQILAECLRVGVETPATRNMGQTLKEAEYLGQEPWQSSKHLNPRGKIG